MKRRYLYALVFRSTRHVVASAGATVLLVLPIW